MFFDHSFWLDLGGNRSIGGRAAIRRNAARIFGYRQSGPSKLGNEVGLVS